MSISSEPQQTGECRHCGEEHPIETAVGAFCSVECQYRHKAQKALNQLRSDHRLCGSCGGVLKEITPPDDEWVQEHGSAEQVALNHGGEISSDGSGQLVLDATECADVRRTAVEAVVGFQSRTEDAELVEKEIDGPHQGLRKYRTATGCKCGATDHSETNDVLRKADPLRTLANYVHVFRTLEREGAIPWRIDKDRFFETYREHEDFDVALGAALYRP